MLGFRYPQKEPIDGAGSKERLLSRAREFLVAGGQNSDARECAPLVHERTAAPCRVIRRSAGQEGACVIGRDGIPPEWPRDWPGGQCTTGRQRRAALSSCGEPVTDAHDLTSWSVLMPDAVDPCVCLFAVRKGAENDAVLRRDRCGIIQHRKERGVFLGEHHGPVATGE